MSPGRNTRGGLTERHHPPRAKCKICECSVFPTDETAWVTSPYPGLAHKTCAEESTTKD